MMIDPQETILVLAELAGRIGADLQTLKRITSSENGRKLLSCKEGKEHLGLPLRILNEMASNDDKGQLFSRKEAAKYLGVTPHTLAVWQCTGRYNLQCVKIGRLAKYRKSDLDEFIQSGTIEKSQGS